MTMHLTDDDVRRFVELWRQEFGEVIPLEPARIRASQVAELYAILAGFPAESSTPDDDLPLPAKTRR